MKHFDVNSVADFFRPNRSKPKAWKKHVYMEWFAILFFAMTMLVCTALWSSYLYSDVVARTYLTNEGRSPSNHVSVDEESLAATLDHFKKKDSLHSAVQATRQSIPDPSR
jgi:hypothetical protein